MSIDRREEAKLRGDRGVSLVELLVVMFLMSLLGALSLTALTRYGQTADHQGSADEMVSSLRATAQRSLSEGRTYCLQIDAAGRAWTVYRSVCGTGVVALQEQQLRRGVRVEGASFTPANAASDTCPAAAGACFYFYPRGTASHGGFDVTRASKTIKINVEGLTSRVTRN